MQRALLLLLLLTTTLSYAQISGPDTVQANMSVTFSASSNATTYAWSTGIVNTTPSNTLDIPIASSSFNTMTQPVMQVENGNYIGFIVNQSGELLKLSYGLSPNNVPTITSLGDFGMTGYNTQGMDILYDNDNWFGFITNAGDLLRLDFGNSLNNIPVATIMDFSADMWYPMQISVIRVSDTEVHAFAGHFGLNSILRFDFGASLTNVPTVTTIGNSNDFLSACNFSLYQESGIWYMLVSNLIGHSLSLVNFGTSLNNNTPVISSLGTFNNTFTFPRTISFLRNCDSLFAIVTNENGDITQLDFNGSITNIPNVSPLLTLPNISGLRTGYPYWFNDTLYMMLTNFNNHDLRIIDLQTLPQNTTNSSGYGLNTFTHSFTAPGIYDLTLQVNQGFATGPTTYCKTVVVEAQTNHINSIKTNSFQLYPNPTNGIITLNVQNLDAQEVEVYCISTLGNIVWKNKVSVINKTINTTIDLSTFAKGLYNIKINTKDKNYSEKIVLQ